MANVMFITIAESDLLEEQSMIEKLEKKSTSFLFPDISIDELTDKLNELIDKVNKIDELLKE